MVEQTGKSVIEMKCFAIGLLSKKQASRAAEIGVYIPKVFALKRDHVVPRKGLLSSSKPISKGAACARLLAPAHWSVIAIVRAQLCKSF